MARRRRFSADQAREDAEKLSATEQDTTPEPTTEETKPESKPNKGKGSSGASMSALVGKETTTSPPTQIDVEIRKIRTDLIDLSPANERDPDLLAGPEFEALVEDIRQHGQDQPAIVVQVPDSDRFELIAGSRRFAAAKSLGRRLKAVVRKDARGWTLDQKARLSMSENAHRSRPTPWERAQWMDYIRHHDEHGHPLPDPMSNAELAERLGYSQGFVRQNRQLVRVTKKTAQALAGVSGKDGQNTLMSLQANLASAALREPSTPKKLEKATLKTIEDHPGLSGRKLIKAIIDRVHGKAMPEVSPWTPLAKSGAEVIHRPAAKPGQSSEFKLKVPENVDVEKLTKEFREFIETALKSKT